MPFRAPIALLIIAMTLPLANAQMVSLRHKFVQDQTAKAKTTVQMNGASLIGTDQAATDLYMEMRRQFHVLRVDPNGGANLTVDVNRLMTKGSMNDAKFNQDITGDKLSQTMLGATQMNLEISPLGYVKEGPHFNLDSLGISLPDGGMSSGGFEVPTFPNEPVQIGDSWTENGAILARQGIQQSMSDGEKVYQLKQIYQTKNGRVGVIHYQKKSDLSGLGLGKLSGEAANTPGLEAFASGLNIPQLSIELEGEIHFNIDRGAVFRSRQEGVWNLGMDVPLSNQQVKSTPLKQKGMGIKIQTEILWQLPQSQNKEEFPKVLTPEQSNSSAALKPQELP